MTPTRRCPACTKPLTIKPTERPAEFRARKYCDWNCSVAGRAIRAAERRAEHNLAATRISPAEDGAEYTRADLLRAAERVAPQVPASIRADIVSEVEPLIAATVRRRLLAHVAARFRSESAAGVVTG